jgi:hypothetical protein
MFGTTANAKTALHKSSVIAVLIFLCARTQNQSSGTIKIESSYMKKISLIIAAFFLVVSAAVSRTDVTADLTRATAEINTQAQANGGGARVLRAISSETGVPVAALQTEQSANRLGYGDLLIANLLASESGKSFSEIVAMFKAGQGGWGKIANDLRLNLGEIVSKAHRAEQAALNAQSNNATGSDKSQGGPAMGHGRGTGFQEQQNSKGTSRSGGRP